MCRKNINILSVEKSVNNIFNILGYLGVDTNDISYIDVCIIIINNLDLSM